MIEKEFSTELDCQFDRRNSFYGKARVIIFKDDSKALYSYSTLVACITPNGKAYIRDDYSKTTTRHIKEFLKQFGFKADNKSQCVKNYYDENFSWKDFMLDRRLH